MRPRVRGNIGPGPRLRHMEQGRAMGKIWEDSPGGKPPRALTSSEIDLLLRMRDSGGRIGLTAEEASNKAIMYLLLRGAIFPSICAGDDSLVYALTSTGQAVCERLKSQQKS